MARLAFIMFCLFPTLGVAAWSWYWRSPVHTQRWEQQLADWLRLHVELEGVEHPQPGVVRLRGVRLADRESAAEVLRAQTIVIRRRAGLLELELVKPEVFALQRDRLISVARELLAHKPSDLPGLLTLRAEGLAWRQDGSPYLARQVAGGMRLSSEASVIELAFLLPGGGKRPARLRAVRDRRGAAGYTLTLTSGDAHLACALLWPQAADWLGREARLRGTACLRYSPQGWSGELAGELLDLDLHRLVSGHFPHQLTGKARLEIEKLVIEQGRIVHAAGTLRCGPGLISRSLLASGGQALGLTAAAKPLPPQDRPLVAYTRLACDFSLGPEGLVLSGWASDALPGAILVDTYGPLWSEPALQPQPAAALVTMLVPAAAAQVPATREAEALLRWLPLEEAPRQP
ncbi:MAG: hypothetical protein K6T86_08260 [Pirellulales bacterium]|nr:hypothetical protein [Pirellulales bacterium]